MFKDNQNQLNSIFPHQAKENGLLVQLTMHPKGMNIIRCFFPTSIKKKVNIMSKSHVHITFCVITVFSPLKLLFVSWKARIHALIQVSSIALIQSYNKNKIIIIKERKQLKGKFFIVSILLELLNNSKEWLSNKRILNERSWKTKILS